MKKILPFLTLLVVSLGVTFIQTKKISESRNLIARQDKDIKILIDTRNDCAESYNRLVIQNGLENDADAEFARAETAEKRLKAIDGFFAYTVQKGDTLSSLSAVFLKDASKWDRIMVFNQLKSETIYEGQEIVINSAWKNIEIADKVAELKNKSLFSNLERMEVISYSLPTEKDEVSVPEAASMPVAEFGLSTNDTTESITTSAEMEKKFKFSPSLHAVLPGGLVYTSNQRWFGSFMGVEAFAAQTAEGDLKLGGLGLNWNIEGDKDNNRLAATVTPLSARIYNRLYGSAGYTHVFAGKDRPASNGVHVQFSICTFGCKE